MRKQVDEFQCKSSENGISETLEIGISETENIICIFIRKSSQSHKPVGFNQLR